MADLKSIFFVGLLIVLMAAFVLTIYHCVAGRPLSPPPTGEEPAGSVVISAALLLPPARSYGKGEGMVYGGDSMCPVCLCDFKDGDAVRQLPECLHYFHAPCIEPWFRSHSNCPICRTETAPFPPPEVGATADVRR